MLLITLLNTVFLAFSVAAVNPVLVERSPITLPISRRTNFTGARNLLRHDQARAKFLKAQGAARADASAHGGTVSERLVINEPVENQISQYIASVGVGSPPTYYNLLIDTGSSNTWVGAGKKYVRTTTSVKTKDKMHVQYGSGSVTGYEFFDRVTLTPELVIANQSIGVAYKSSGLDDDYVDGILGIGPTDLTVDTLKPDTKAEIPTVTDNLFANGAISANQIGIFFAPYNSQDIKNGEITWGGTDNSKLTGPITYMPITSTPPSSYSWGIDQSVRYGESTTILTTTSGIVDTGTTLILIAREGFEKYKRATNATLDSSHTGLLKINAHQFKRLKSLFFIAGGTSFELIPNAQIWPRALNVQIAGTASEIYLIIGDIGSDVGEGLDFISGFAFLERFYYVFDTGNQRVGFATTPFTKATTN